MLNSKKIISTALALLVTAVSPVSVYAAETLPQTAAIYALKPSDSINWTYTSWVGAGISIEDDYAQCVGSYELYSDLKSEITLSLMRSKDGKNWSTVEYWTTINYKYNPISFSQKSTNELEHGYYYRTHTQVQVYKNGKVVETGNSFSSYEYYA